MGLTFQTRRQTTGPTPPTRSPFPIAGPKPPQAASSSEHAGTAIGPAPLSHSFDRIAVAAPGDRAAAEESRLGISSSGDPTVTIKYTPEAGDKSTKIVFIQVVQLLLDSVAVRPKDIAPYAFLDADATSDLYFVDHFTGEADPYYNGDDAGKDTGTQGNATSKPPVDADMTDTPNLSDAGFPAGKTTFNAQFRTLAFSAAGADKGMVYAYAKWSYTREKGKTAAIAHEGTSKDAALPKSRAAIDLWCKNHGFALPQ